MLYMYELLVQFLISGFFYVVANTSLECQAEGAETEKTISITKSNQGRNHIRGELIFSDEFNTFNLETWQHENTLGGSTWEFEMYTNSRKNSFVRNGILFIKPTLTSETFGADFMYKGQWAIEGSYPVEMCTDPRNYGCKRAANYGFVINPAMSAKLTTVSSFYFKYGRIEVRAKLPGGDWMWPKIGLMPRFNGYGQWPNSGDIRLVESRGNQLLFDEVTGRHIGTESISSALHFGPNYMIDRYDSAAVEWTAPKGKGYDRDFHTYGLTWTDELMEFTLDGTVIRRITPNEKGFWSLGGFNDKDAPNPWRYAANKRMAPFDQKFYLVLNVAVGGGDYFPDNAVNKKGKKPWINNSTEASVFFYERRHDWHYTWEGDGGALQIDYVRVYAI